MNNAQQINQTSLIVEYYTNRTVASAANQLLGKIELDPATSQAANKIIGANRIFTAPEEIQINEWTTTSAKGITKCLPVFKREGQCGTKRSWKAKTLWMNHPFGKTEKACQDGCGKEVCFKRGFHLVNDTAGNAEWIAKLNQEFVEGFIGEALCITYACTSEGWFQPLMQYPQCYLSPRTNYLTPDGKIFKGVTKGSVISYLGSRVEDFNRVFSKLGTIKVKYVTPEAK